MRDSAVPSEMPELGDDCFDRAELTRGDVPAEHEAKQPTPNSAREQIMLRLDPAVIREFRATGQGWQTLINDVLRDWLDAHAM